MRGPFTDVADADLDRFLAQTPMCWIVPHTAVEAAILMPVVASRDGQGLSLLGHLPRRAPATDRLGSDGRASFLFFGANGYVSPAMAGRDDWAPTWNFTSARLTGEIAIDGALTREAVEAAVALMEGPDGWRIDAVAHRAEALLARVIGFRADISEAVPRFKLGQDEDPDTRKSIRAAYAGTSLGEWLAAGDGA